MKEIPLAQGQVALVDNEDYYWLNKYTWCYHPRTGITRKEKLEYSNSTIYMHRAILEYHGFNIYKLHVDHINGLKTDNRKCNLRPATPSQNIANSFKYGGKGSYFDKTRNKWRAMIKINYKPVHLGYFNTEQEARQAYDIAARKYFGEFARTNEPVVVEDAGYGSN